MFSAKPILVFWLFILLLGCDKDNQPPKISINDIVLDEGNAGTTSFEFLVTLNKPAPNGVNISYTTGEVTAKSSEDYVAVTNQLLSFQPNETQKKISIAVTGDEIIEDDETFTVRLSNPVNCTIEKETGTATIRNDDMPPMVQYKLYGVALSPYMDGQNPDQGTQIGEQQIIQLLNKVKYYTNWIRTYGSTDGLEKIGVNAYALGLKIAQGAWLGRDMNANQRQIDNLIALGKAGHIDVAIVGSEVLLRGDLTKAQLIAYINQVRAALPNLPITTADVYQTFLSNPDLVSAIDVIYAHIYPYWEGVSIGCATYFVNNVYEQLKAKAQNKEVIVAETGWPSAGNTVGKAVPSPANAALYFLNFISWARIKGVNYYYFEYMDEAWKQIHEGPQGANWGIFFKNNGDLKPGMERVFNNEINPDNWLPCPDRLP